MGAARNEALGHLHAGFVAMEYFALILNRSFIFFITAEGLWGLKFRGPVSSRWPEFYKPIEAFLDDPEMEPGSIAFNEFIDDPKAFLIPYDEIKSAQFVAKAKWGMGPISHSGILTLALVKGGRREFILLGAAYGDGIRNAIAARLLPGSAQ
jgi:hypothetical protein